MNDRLLIGTRKGLFDIRRTRGTWTIAATRFLGDPISMLLTDPRDGTCYAAQALGHFGVKLQRSRDDGETWQEIPAPAFPKDTPDGPSVSYIFCLETGGAEQPGWIWCGSIPGALFLSRDHGETWSLNEPLWNVPERKEWMGGGFDQAALPRSASTHATPAISRSAYPQAVCGSPMMAAKAGARRSMACTPNTLLRSFATHRRCRMCIALCNARRRRTPCGRSTTTACSVRPMARAPGRMSPRSARRSSVSRLWRIRAIRTRRGSCPA